MRQHGSRKGKNMEFATLQDTRAQTKKRLGKRIKAARKQAGITQKQLAEKSGINAVVLGRYECGKEMPRDGNLTKLAAALGIEKNELTGNHTSAGKGFRRYRTRHTARSG